MMSLICEVICKFQTHRNREQIGVFQKVGELCEWGENIQTSYYNINKLWRCNMQQMTTATNFVLHEVCPGSIQLCNMKNRDTEENIRLYTGQ